MTSITVYDGNDTIGGNKIYVEENGKGVFLDFGANIHNYDKFYKFPSKPRTYRGIYDYWVLNFIPHLNIYRKDLIPIDLDITPFPKLDIQAVFLSHVHMDHYGNIGFLDEKIPVVASSITFALLKGVQDTITRSSSSDVVYINKKRPNPSEPRVLIPAGRFGRSLITTDKYNERLEEFLWQSSRKTTTIKAGDLSRLDNYELPFKVTPFETDHSVYGSVGYILEGEHSIAYTGDIRLHGKSKRKSIDFIRSAKNSEILIIEGTRLTGENIFDSEEFVYDSCYRAVDISKGLVIADFTSRNLERLELFKKIALETNKQLVITHKDAYLLYALELADGIDHLKDTLIYQRRVSRPPFWESTILKEAKDPRYVNSEDINGSPDGYIVCFSTYDIPNFLDITPKEGIYIYSSTGAFKTEQEFDFIRLNEWLNFTGEGIKPKGFRVEGTGEEARPVFHRGFHASGHASEDELEWMIETIDPEIIIPVHTENLKWFKERYGDKAKILEKGEKLII